MVPQASASSRVVLHVAHRTDPGRDPSKQVNEDACGERDFPQGHLLVVCDGMGGHAGGKEASELAVRTILAQVELHQQPTPALCLKSSIERANAAVHEMGGNHRDMYRPGSTVVSLLVHPGGTEVAHVGDSRGYVIRSGKIVALTSDHSMVQQLVNAGVLSPEEAARHPDANKITRALGMAPVVEVEVRPTPFSHQVGDVYLLASDGLCDLLQPQEILDHAAGLAFPRDLSAYCERLVDSANARGGHDNITVLVAMLLDAPPVASPQARTVVPEPGGQPASPPPLATQPLQPAWSGRKGDTVTDDPEAAPTLVDQPIRQRRPSSDRPGVDHQRWRRQQDRRRSGAWILVGIVLLLLSLSFAASCIWWAWQQGSSALRTPVRDTIANPYTPHYG